jgi:hypothetical protein
LLTGCASPDLVFVTKTSIGVDVDAQSASLAYDRTEGYFAPRQPNRETVPVFASASSDGTWLTRNVKQVYATGNAAKLVSGPVQARPQPAAQQALYRNTVYDAGAKAVPLPQASAAQHDSTTASTNKSLFFGTGNLLGFKIGWGTGSAVDTFTFGYKRKEISIIPRDENDKEIPSVMASLDTGTSAAGPTDSKFAVKQFFATGEAADTLANSDEIHRLFQSEARSRLEQYRDDERHQRDYALTSLACLAELDDTKAPKVWQNAQELELFEKETTDSLLAEKSVGKQRAIYTRGMASTDATSSMKTGLMKGHAAYVCHLLDKA